MSQTDNVVTVVTKATKALSGISATVAKVTAELSGLTEVTAELAGEIEFRQSELDQINESIATGVRKAAAEMGIQVLENEARVMADLMEKARLATISLDALQTLQSELLEAKKDNADLITSAVKSAVRSTESKAEMATLEATSAHSVEVADYKAEISALKREVEFLTANAAKAEEAVRASQATEIAIATAKASQVINTTVTK